MSWQVYIVISIFLLSCNGLFHRSLLKDDNSSPQAQTIIFLGIGGVIAIIIAIVRGGLNLHFPIFLIWNFLLLAVMLTPAYLLKYKAFQLIGASEVVMFSVTARLWTVAGAFFVLHEVITLKMVVGAVIILAGVMITRYEQRKFTINKGVLLVLSSAFLFGIGEINGYFILRNYDSNNFLIYSELLPVIALLLIQPKSIKKVGYYFRKDRAIKLLLLCFCDALGNLALYQAYKVGNNAAVIGPLRAMSVIVTVILATVILKERNNVKNKFIGAAVSVAGVILLLK
jgi:drug/metabolite transporter (DMT)-like permease